MGFLDNQAPPLVAGINRFVYHPSGMALAVCFTVEHWPICHLEIRAVLRYVRKQLTAYTTHVLIINVHKQVTQFICMDNDRKFESHHNVLKCTRFLCIVLPTTTIRKCKVSRNLSLSPAAIIDNIFFRLSNSSVCEFGDFFSKVSYWVQLVKLMHSLNILCHVCRQRPSANTIARVGAKPWEPILD